jgi:cell shape-determining protein MreC
MIGKFFAFLKTVPGYIICILTPFLAIILMQAFNCVKLFKVYKAEKMEEIESEKKALEEERARSKEMMEELIRLREQLGVAQSTSNSDSSDENNSAD